MIVVADGEGGIQLIARQEWVCCRRSAIFQPRASKVIFTREFSLLDFR